MSTKDPTPVLLKWSLGRIVEGCPHSEGDVRVVDVKLYHAALGREKHKA